MKRLLHAGCGSKLNKVPLSFGACKEVRLDLDRNCNPDIVASVVAMPMIEDDTFDAVYCSHCLEHLYAIEGVLALKEFLRVLKPGGELQLVVPDLQSIGGKIALDLIGSIAYMSALGPVTPLDILYGHQGSIGSGSLHMAHKMGFTSSSLKSVLFTAGFVDVSVCRERGFDLEAVGFKELSHAGQERSPEEILGSKVWPRVAQEAPL